mmetsp:Transcript_42894/g.76954  ORF Transcript_42894/g.76954 Transcript_42894/m.76954 type:complete len:230 (-) Transcript_42894:580-1269(-)
MVEHHKAISVRLPYLNTLHLRSINAYPIHRVTCVYPPNHGSAGTSASAGNHPKCCSASMMPPAQRRLACRPVGKKGGVAYDMSDVRMRALELKRGWEGMRAGVNQVKARIIRLRAKLTELLMCVSHAASLCLRNLEHAHIIAGVAIDQDTGCRGSALVLHPGQQKAHRSAFVSHLSQYIHIHSTATDNLSAQPSASNGFLQLRYHSSPLIRLHMVADFVRSLLRLPLQH